MKSKIFVIEDHPLMRRSMVESIEREADLAVCGEAGDAAEALLGIERTKPDLVLADIHLKSASGLSLVPTLRWWRTPSIPVVAISLAAGNGTKQNALEAGAAAFVSKHDGPGKMIEAIHAVLKGRSADQ